MVKLQSNEGQTRPHSRFTAAITTTSSPGPAQTVKEAVAAATASAGPGPAQRVKEAAPLPLSPPAAAGWLSRATRVWAARAAGWARRTAASALRLACEGEGG